MANIGIIGSGSWGTAIAHLLSENGHQVTVWSYLQEETDHFLQDHESKDKLPGVMLPEEMRFTSDLKEASEGRDLLVFVVPSPVVRGTAKALSPFVEKGTKIVSLAKGIEETTLMTMSDILEQEIPQADVAVLSGPSHAEEVGRDLPTTIVAGAHTRETAEAIQAIFMSPVFRVYTSSDMLGIQIGGALKNVIALAAGIADGIGYGDNTKAALITRGSTEIARIGSAMGAHRRTLFGLSGIGDLIVTCASLHSRNRRAGYLIGQGNSMEEAMKEVHQVVEGVFSAKAGLALAEKYHVSAPIIEVVNEVLFDGLTPKDAVRELMLREGKDEIEEW
jgi:glycerol-3-phosphate dehydrogenase (NAD(P)+)